jgi:hypothetical protein
MLAFQLFILLETQGFEADEQFPASLVKCGNTSISAFH